MLVLLHHTFFLLAAVGAQSDLIAPMPGSQVDNHGCVLDGGYRWCESARQCQRPWDQPCAASPCGDMPCPPPVPCPSLAMMPNHCVVVPAAADKCGCTIGCPQIDCSRVASEEEVCGGYMATGVARVCDRGLECVYPSMGMVADAPGSCMPVCPTVRDSFGNCVGGRGAPAIPDNCVTWYDGCNTCSAEFGELRGCTLMMCFTQNEPYCQVFSGADLRLDDICYRFCENGAQSTVDRRKQCPAGTECAPPTGAGGIGYDSCAEQAHTCTVTGGH